MVIPNASDFFAHVRTELFGGHMTESQVAGINTIIAAWPDGTDYRWLAYALATALHETGRTMQPIEEWGKGKGRPYGVPAGPWHKVYDGRGLMQETWYSNYLHADNCLHADGTLKENESLVENPDLALRPDIAARIMVRGMSEAWFTGKKLSDYFNANQTDWVNARRIINGLDKAAQIASYAVHFRRALDNPTSGIAHAS